MKLAFTVRFNRLPRTALATKQAVLQMVEKASADIAAGAKLRAPVDTGALAASIDFDVEGTFTGAEGIVYTPIEYGIYQEFGTRHHGPQPFMVPAAMEVQQQIDGLASIVGSALERAARGG